MKLLFYDLETTGFGFDRCAIIQLAAIVVDINTDGEMKPVDAINLKMKPRPGKMIDQRSLEVNGYSIDDLMSFQDDHQAFEKFIKFLSKHVNKYDAFDKMTLCGYNIVHFDNDFLRQWFVDNGENFFGSYFFSSSIDVMCEAARYLQYYKAALANFKLGNIASVLGIKLDAASLHDGLYDVKVTYKVFKKIMDSGQLIKPFNEEEATEMFNDQQVVKSKMQKSSSAFTEETAWVVMK